MKNIRQRNLDENTLTALEAMQNVLLQMSHDAYNILLPIGNSDIRPEEKDAATKNYLESLLNRSDTELQPYEQLFKYANDKWKKLPETIRNEVLWNENLDPLFQYYLDIVPGGITTPHTCISTILRYKEVKQHLPRTNGTEKDLPYTATLTEGEYTRTLLKKAQCHFTAELACNITATKFNISTDVLISFTSPRALG